MKPATEPSITVEVRQSIRIELPCGLIGLPHLRKFEVSFPAGSWPFANLTVLDEEKLNFLALQPQDIIPGYEIELSDEDAAEIGATDARDVLVFNVVTVHSDRPQYVTANLIGPIVVNRRTFIGRQVILKNSDNYSASHVLVDEREISQAA